jgi:hypothetical protein
MQSLPRAFLNRSQNRDFTGPNRTSGLEAADRDAGETASSRNGRLWNGRLWRKVITGRIASKGGYWGVYDEAKTAPRRSSFRLLPCQLRGASERGIFPVGLAPSFDRISGPSIMAARRSERPTLGFEVRCSIQLSYERVSLFNALAGYPFS